MRSRANTGLTQKIPTSPLVVIIPVSWIRSSLGSLVPLHRRVFQPLIGFVFLYRSPRVSDGLSTGHFRFNRRSGTGVEFPF